MGIQTETIAEGITLYCGDCREILPTLGKIDAVITDPPFNAGKEFQNDNLSKDEWNKFCTDIACLFLNMKSTNYLIEMGKNDSVMRSIMDTVLPYRWAIALNYTNAMRNGACGYSNFGLVYWYGNKCFKRYMDRIDASLESTLDEFKHPSPKEPRHYMRLIEMFSPENGFICDPFMGSGTTGIASVKMGRRFTGIEIEPKYYDIARRRITDALKQPDLFVELPKPVQLTWDQMWSKPFDKPELVWGDKT